MPLPNTRPLILGSHPTIFHASMEPQQTDNLPGDLLPRFVEPQQYNSVLRNPAVSLASRDNLPRMNVHISLQNVV